MSTDHISRALERAQSEQRSVRSWVRPSTAAPAVDVAIESERTASLDPAHLLGRHILGGRGQEDPAVSDRYRLLRTKVLQMLRVEGRFAVGVTSPGPKDGKSLTSINLAISIAREGGYSVVLIDGDIRKPTLAQTLGIPDRPGLFDYLSSDISLSAVLVRTDVPNLYVLPGRSPDESGVAAPELLVTDKMHQLIDGLRARERCVLVVDLPPVRLGDDVVALAPQLDGILVVVREAGTTVDELREAAHLLKDFKVLGTVMNQSSERKLHFEGYYYHGGPEKK